MAAAPGLAALLAALREAGLRIGVEEELRIGEVLSRRHDVPDGQGGRRLAAVLRAVVVKSRDDREVFDRVFRAWLARVDEGLTPRERAALPTLRPASRRRSRRVKPWMIHLSAVVAVALGLTIWWGLPSERPLEPVLPPPPPPPTENIPPTSPSDLRDREFTDLIPKLEIATGGLWRALRDRRGLPEPAEPPSRPGPPRVFLTPPGVGEPELLDVREQEVLVWGIGRYVSEELTPRLDIPATVRATADAGGLPELRFERARFHREVWLWIDETADDPTLPRLADEIEATLKLHGLPVERATFRGLPERLVTPAGQAFAPREIDERRHAALVAILTDGRVLCRQALADDRAARIDAVLRELSHWPRLAFVDFSGGANDLARRLERHEIDVIEPEELATFLGTATPPPGEGGSAPPADALWATACALPPASIAEASALELRRELDLETSPWALRSLRALAGASPGRLRFTPAARAAALNWLVGTEGDGGVPEDGVLARALDFWTARYDAELARRTTEDEAWLESPASLHLRMERAILDLWREPAAAARTLFELYQEGTLREPIGHHLAGMAPRGRGGEGQIELPWAWPDAELSDAARFMLLRMNLGGGMADASLRRPGRLLAGLGMAAGLACGALALAALRPMEPANIEPVFDPPPEQWADGLVGRRQSLDVSLWGLQVTNEKWVDFDAASRGSIGQVTWAVVRQPCIESLGDIELWRCGRVATEARLVSEDRRSVAVLEAPLGDPDAEELAASLLDSGSADVVAIGESWETERVRIVGGLPLQEGDQLLVVAKGDGSWGVLADRLRFEGERPARQVWPGAVLSESEPTEPRLRGLSLGCQPGQEREVNGIEFVRICPGTFMMGSPSSEPDRGTDETLHEVTLTAEFWIGKYEVTNEQYLKHKPGHRSTGFETDNRDDRRRPVTDVDWGEAKGFCESLGGSLPTEAEWEYAARAGKETPWSFGGDESQLSEYAQYGEDFNVDAYPVGGKKPNPWGLYDMHGNVWEWVEDWYGPYPEEPQVDPTGPLTGDVRVLRGGAFNVGPRNLRSAVRGRGGPEFSGRIIGFRCVLAPRRQP